MNWMPPAGLKDFMDEQVRHFNTPDFIPNDPVCIPHLFTTREDREISGFMTALIAWGQRPAILKNARALMQRMDNAPAAFILNHQPAERKAFRDFVHRTFQGTDTGYLLKALQLCYRHSSGLEGMFTRAFHETQEIGASITLVRQQLLSFSAPGRFAKHLADPSRNSAAKRINMFLRWMVRKDQAGVDFGLWKEIPPSALCCPLDIHSGRIARQLGLLDRKQDDWKAVNELTERLRLLDPDDPVKYDFALFGTGVKEKNG